jgi:hypothetical protein
MAFPQLNTNAKDWIQAASWVSAVAAGLIGVIKILIELKQSRLQRVQELRWRKAEAAKSLNDEMLSDEGAHAALTMLDWDGREFKIQARVQVAITHEVMLGSLRTINPTFSDPEMFVRDSFDDLFYYLGIFEHYISRGLVDFMDVEQPIKYYVKLMAANRLAFESYIRTYGFELATAFLERFESWRTLDASEAGSA